MDDTQDRQREAAANMIMAQQSGNTGGHERQSVRDIRQWAIAEAGRWLSDTDKILEVARKYAAFVESAS